jgi:murein DD-endopeptidase MepM/ murein hydrolase activator NlpD
MRFRPKSTFAGQAHKFILPFLCLILFVAVISCNSHQGKESTTFTVRSSDTGSAKGKPASLLFGIPVDSFNIIRGKIRANSFLSEILSEYGVTPRETDLIIRNSRSIFNVRGIKSGNNFTILTQSDSTARLRYFIYENDPTLYYIFSFNDSLHITPFRVNPRTEIKFSTLTIETSLWDALIGKGLNPELAVDLSDIYAWTVDFFGLQKGDRFRFIYEENFIGEKAIGTGRIIGAEFISAEKEIYALPMIQQGKESYYDSQGNSLRKEFLKAPLHFSRIASGFSSARMHPILRIVRPHFGVDYAAPAGTPVYSIGDGTVISATFEQESGRIVRIKHNSVYTTAYMHLSGFANGIASGVKVKQGDVIGYVGSTGLATGPHLDFRFYMNGYAVDPLKVEAPPVEPVMDENRAKFEKIKSVVVGLLDAFH